MSFNAHHCELCGQNPVEYVDRLLNVCGDCASADAKEEKLLWDKEAADRSIPRLVTGQTNRERNSDYRWSYLQERECESDECGEYRTERLLFVEPEGKAVSVQDLVNSGAPIDDLRKAMDACLILCVKCA